MHTTTRRSSDRQRRPLWGIRDAPGRAALRLLRLPLRSARAGHLPGQTFVSFTHRGRVTGRSYETVAMALRHDADTGEVVVCAAWGPDTDWVRNLRAAPATAVRVGRSAFAPRHRFLDDDEARAVLGAFYAAHPARSRLMSAVLGWGDLRDDAIARSFVQTHPFVAFRPTEPAPADTT